MAQLLALTSRTSAWLALLGGMLIAAAGIGIAAEIMLRAAGRTIGGMDELSGYALAIGSSWSLAYCLLEKGHIRIDTVYGPMPARIRAWLDVLALALLGGVAALLAWHATDLWALAVTFMSRSLSNLQVPLWVPQGLWAFGLIWFSLTSFVLLGATLSALLSGDLSSAAAISGIPRAEEEVEAEVLDARRRGQGP